LPSLAPVPLAFIKKALYLYCLMAPPGVYQWPGNTLVK
jgi:hypothetical protein